MLTLRKSAIVRILASTSERIRFFDAQVCPTNKFPLLDHQCLWNEAMDHFFVSHPNEVMMGGDNKCRLAQLVNCPFEADNL